MRLAGVTWDLHPPTKFRLYTCHSWELHPLQIWGLQWTREAHPWVNHETWWLTPGRPPWWSHGDPLWKPEVPTPMRSHSLRKSRTLRVNSSDYVSLYRPWSKGDGCSCSSYGSEGSHSTRNARPYPSCNGSKCSATCKTGTFASLHVCVSCVFWFNWNWPG